MKTIKYLLLLFTLVGLELFAGSERLIEKLNYESSYEKALEKAQELNKPIMMVIGQAECPWCSKFEVKTLIRKNINTTVQENFIPLTLLRNKDIFPKKFHPEGVPTVLFIEPKQQEAFYKSFGYKSKREYKIELKNAIDMYNNKHKM